MGRIIMKGYACERCRHEWVPRSDEEPRVCPRCKSPYWNRPRINSRISTSVPEKNIRGKTRKRGEKWRIVKS